MESYILCFLIAVILTYVSTPVAGRIARQVGAVDYPNTRRVNQHPVVNLGGLAIYVGVIAAVLFTAGINSKLLGIIISSTLMLVIGLIDDLRGLSPTSKFIWQIIAALLVTSFGIKIEFITNPLGGVFYLGALSIPFTVFWLVAITNTVNLIDGLDGLAAGVSTIAAVTLLVVAIQEAELLVIILTIAVAGACIGFLQYNFNPAQIFMGDTGSLFLGFLLAAISALGALKSAAAATLVVPILALGVPIFDTAFAIIRRRQKGEPLFQADRGHLHHRLLELGLSHKETVIVVYLISLSLGLVAIAVNGVSELQAFGVLAILAVILFYGSYKLGVIELNLDSREENYKSIN
ncbi:glycosyltransferase family 4 protein [Acetohalobium arabaticum]|uniref:Glycosyl transferase, family 4, conserved region n=1 Tax=Acetohalobium arabaticum (strain ATCC 49924 / DSM 5501 / Z-7288) TaxID=574087 RepID=D9QTZ2_ACEAZ|nr:MraY family glycosyltransferase [Acetohalobium arabaticum]ADL13713.1 Glycosyl transferase, family 4, conserved region [Acetohalobium arabaticum DSM 5501]